MQSFLDLLKAAKLDETEDPLEGQDFVRAPPPPAEDRATYDTAPARAPARPLGVPAARDLGHTGIGGVPLPEDVSPRRLPVGPGAGPVDLGGRAVPPSIAAASRQPMPKQDDELLSAQRMDSLRSGAGRVSDALYSAFTRTPLQYRGTEGSAAKDLLARRGEEQRQTAVAAAAGDDDPNSEQSRAMQEMIARALPGVAGQLGPAVAKLSYGKALKLFPFLREMMEGDREKTKLESTKATLEAKKADEAARNERELQEQLAREERANAEARKRMGISNAAAMERAKVLGSIRTEERAGERSAKAAEGIPPEWEVVEGGSPTEDDKKKFKVGLASKYILDKTAAEMRAALANTSEFERLKPGPKRDRLKQLATIMKVEGKNVADLGALSGPDEALMEAIQQDPTDAMTVAFGDYEKALKGVGSWADNRVNAFASTSGLRRRAPTATGAARARIPVGQVGGDTVMVQPPGGGEPVPVHRSKVDAAIKAGGKVVGGG